MRIDVLFGSLVLATALGASAAHAGTDGCCITAPFPAVIWAPFVAPPTRYVLNPSDAAGPFYIVNQGPQLPSLGGVARVRPDYSERGYAFADEYPYIVSYGSGGYRAFRHAPAFVRPFGARHHTAYR